MIQRFLNRFGNVLYLQIWSDRLKFTNANNGKCFDEKPCLAIKQNSNGKKIILDIGNGAAYKKGGDVQIINPFHHPRILIADFTVAEKIVQHAMRQILSGQLFNPSPFVIVHPMERIEGGITGIERRAFEELARGAGAFEAVVYTGNEIPNKDLNIKTVRELLGILK